MDSVALTAVLLVATLVANFVASLAKRRRLALATASLALAASMVLVYQLYRSGTTLRIGVLGLSLACDYLSLVVALNAAILGIASLVASYRYIEEIERGYGPYYLLLTVFTLSMVFTVLVRDWLWFLLFFELMTFASYFLVGYNYGDEVVRRVAFNYFVTMHLLCTTPLLIGVGMVYASLGTLQFARAALPPPCLAALIVGLATKAGLVPLHFWLPDAHPTAPTPVSALLSGAMVEIGVYGIARIFAMYSPPTELTTLLLAMSIASTAIGVASYYRQRDVKRLLAWSTIDNVGWMCLAIAVGASPALVAEYVLNHGLAKSSAFLSTALLTYAFSTRSIEELRGCFTASKFCAGLFIVSLFALEGTPPFAFFWNKLGVVIEVMKASTVLGIALAMLWVLAFLQILAVVHKLIEGEPRARAVKPVPRSMVGPIVALLAILLISSYLLNLLR